MSSDYRIAAGHDVVLGSLTVLSPQPRGLPVRPTQRTYGLSRTAYDNAPYCEWVFDYFESVTTYGAMLTAVGLGSLNVADVTIYTRGPRLTYIRYNATVTLPEMGQEGDWSNYYLRNVVFRFTNLTPV